MRITTRKLDKTTYAAILNTEKFLGVIRINDTDERAIAFDFDSRESKDCKNWNCALRWFRKLNNAAD
ncbi:MAG: hypothetical protein MZV70_29265 [Desulfobacterales bacterium]|nr:hypothetical protein [Desulfobacterales bacterium]